MVKALIVTGFGINCEEEMAAAYAMAGASADIIHLNDILLKKFSIHSYDIINFPGGFSFGDDIASGRVLANKIKFKKLASGTTFLQELQQFLAAKKYILGICNGFQVLVKLGLLPNIGGTAMQEVTLLHNDSGKYEDRWVYCKANQASNTPFLRGIDIIALPVRHGEGKLHCKDLATEQAIVEQHLNCLTYCHADGTTATQYPDLPNGSALSCAALTSPCGQVFGMMPHPEAYLSLYNHPDWAKQKQLNPALSDEGEGLQIFRNIVAQISQQKNINATER